MDVAVVAQVLLAGVLLVSGLAKALDPAGTRTAAVGLGVPARLAPATAVALPLAEILTAGLLVVVPVLGLLVALLLLSAFSTAVGLTLVQGRRPTCRCFGRLGGGEVSGKTLARNGVLMAAAFVGLVSGPAAPRLLPALVGLLLAGLLLGLEVLDGQRGDAARLAALEGSLAGSVPAPDFSVPLLDGGTVSRDELLAAGRPLVLVVLSPGCGSCITTVPHLRRWARDHGDALSLAVVGLSSPGLVRDLVGDLALPVLVDEGGPLRDLLGVHGTPAAVLLSPDGRLVGQPAVGAPAVHALVEAVLAGAGAAPLDAEDLDAAFVPQPVEGVRVEPQPDGGVLLEDELTGARLQLDRVGAVVWSVLDGTGSVGDIATDIAEAFSAPREVVEADVLRLVRDLGRAGLLRGVRAEAPEAAPTTREAAAQPARA